MHNQETIKILGMHWLPNEDSFEFRLKFEVPTEITKRSILSTIARLYDPLGYIAPIIVAAKIVLKQTWNCSNLDWDNKPPDAVISNFKQFTNTLPDIKHIAVPRWLNYDPDLIQSIELHAFCDGSTSAYAAAVYVRIQNHDNTINTHLIVAKCKVTPSKPLTIPKIELNGAELAVKLANWVKEQIRISIDRVYYWCDATIVLYWIYGDVSRLKTYVANRITKILQHSQSNQWNHVGTKENPADCATRGLTPNQLASFELWWNGPSWLRQPKDKWPVLDLSGIHVDEQTAEMKPPKVHIHTNIHIESIIHSSSSYTRIIRVNAWIRRFKHNCQSKRLQQSRSSGPLTVHELHKSLQRIVHLVQLEAFHTEMDLIQTNEPLPKKCKISGLAPFIENGILRVRGRLQRANLSYQQKHPMILPSTHNFTRLLIEDAHRRTLHGGAQIVLSHLKQQFWIIDGKRTVQLQLRKCVTCYKRKPENMTQLMGNLPAHRVNPSQRPFLATGVDYTAAFQVKASRFRGNTTYKSYVAVFICLATKAVHLEAVTGMTTKHFLWALFRFIGRRGICHDMYSDNGTNFVGAERTLANNEIEFAEAITADVVPKLTALGIQWHFNPPHSPNFGGIWEANVKSVKYHLKRVLDYSHLTYEELSTVLARIEAVLNSRPLCPLSMDPDDVDVLTPGHFLIGSSLLSSPEKPDLTIALSDNYVAMQEMVQQFWKKWSTDWLSHLQNRPKWQNIQPNLQINDIVIIKDDRTPINKWLLGRIIEIHPGQDGLVRVATVRTKNGSYKRSISKLCRLPITNELNADNNSNQNHVTNHNNKEITCSN